MRGTGRATGAITFVNALATGVGSAAGVALAVEAEVELQPTRATTSLRIQPEAESPLVRAALTTALQQWTPGRAWSAELRLRSEVPPARGLKSSSAVSTAVARAVAAALQMFVTNDEVGRLSADVSQAIGISATGAFDDALATLEPGVHVTNNARRQRLRSDPIDPSWQVLLWVPRQSHLPSPVYRERFREIGERGKAAERAALRGDPLAAMDANTKLVEDVVGYDYSTLRADLERRGALASGVSGLGPALAVISPPERVSGLLRTLPPGRGDVLVTRFAGGPLEYPPGGLTWT